jgi:hypothetical protein
VVKTRNIHFAVRRIKIYLSAIYMDFKLLSVQMMQAALFGGRSAVSVVATAKVEKGS